MRFAWLLAGVIFISVGIVSFLRGGLAFNHRITDASGPGGSISHETTSTVGTSPYVSGAVLLVGACCLVAGFRVR